MFHLSKLYFFLTNENGSGSIRDQCCYPQGDGASLSSVLVSFLPSGALIRFKDLYYQDYLQWILGYLHASSGSHQDAIEVCSWPID